MKKSSYKSTAVFLGLMNYLREKGEEKLLPEVAKSLEDAVAKSKKSDEIEVSSACPLNSRQLELLRNLVNKKLNINLPIVNYIDKGLIGGFTVRVNDWFMDSSVSHQLQFIKRSLLS